MSNFGYWLNRLGGAGVCRKIAGPALLIPILDFRPRRGDMNGFWIDDCFSLVLPELQASHL